MGVAVGCFCLIAVGACWKKDSVFHGQITLHFLKLQECAPRLFRGVCFVLNGFDVLIYTLFSIN
ncbi:hypothetical protein COH58_11345 [Neisseria meningitidis]|nr:hypothetical protein COH58_11345 [Neisseria meningitidis]